MPVPKAVESIPVEAARALLVRGAGLCDDPRQPATPASILNLIRNLGFVQLDSINAVERAHHHILWTRRHAYQPAILDRLQRTGKVFEHWTHDASIIPTECFPHWRHRFASVDDWDWSNWLQGRLGKDRETVLRSVIERIRAEGPLMARDFEHAEQKSGAWWDWKPGKAALEFWWRAGELAIPRRENFHKVYDLTERVLPHVHPLPAPDRAAHIDWACTEAIKRLGVASLKEIAAFYASISVAEARQWSVGAVASGVVVPVAAIGLDGTRKPSLALPNWKRLASAAKSPDGMRILNPFDPITRDRARCLRLFGFDYRFEAFTPAAKRKYGYYVLPILESKDGIARIVGRLDPELIRDRGHLRVRKLWWEPGIKPTRERRRALEDAVAAYAAFNKAERWEIGNAD